MGYNLELMTWVGGISIEQARSELLTMELLSVLNFFDYWQEEEVREEYIDLYNAYADCLLSTSKISGGG